MLAIGSDVQEFAETRKPGIGSGVITMLRSGQGAANARPDVTRRDFLRVGGCGAFGLLRGGDANALSQKSNERAVILLMLVGGPSQLETWDPKPEAASEIRGPFRAIESAVPGVRINEYLPRMARRLDRIALIRSLSHDAAPIHETGHQLIQTGRLCRLGEEEPHVGSVVARLLGPRNDRPPFVVLPGPIGNTGINISHGQSAGWLGADFEPFTVADGHIPTHRDPRDFDLSRERASVRDTYGRTAFGRNCLLARRLVEAGARFVTVNMFDTVFHKVTWDCHGSEPFSTLDDYANELLPTFDMAYSALLDDLDRRGLLETTLVVATGEFGRTPKLNAAGGRDHWPGVWSAALAGGGCQGGQVVGASDAQGADPLDRPVTPAELVATMYQSLGIDPARTFHRGEGEMHALAGGAAPVGEVFA